MLDGIKRLELMCKSFPCLILLHLSIETRMSRLFNTNKCKLILNDIDNKYISINDEFAQFVFGNAFFHLQRSLLCKHIEVMDILPTSLFVSNEISNPSESLLFAAQVMYIYIYSGDITYM